MKKLLTITLSLCMALVSCDKDDSGSGTPEPQPHNPNTFFQNFGSEIQRNFIGKVIDTDHNPIEGVAISIGSSSAMTDANGIFIINGATVNQRFGYVKASKAGYLHGSRAVVPSEGTNKITIMLLPETVAGTTNSGTAETIALPNGASVGLQGDYVKEDGSTYDGSVNVIMHHLDPADPDMRDQMPGMLFAANSQNQARMLQTFGMLAVELRGSGGEQLNLAEGSSAEIKVPLDASLMADAPSSIPLWHFDEQYGYWIEDGVATLEGNAYVGTVTHFSFWNCDIPAEYVNLCIKVVDNEDNPFNHLQIQLTSAIYGTSYGYTNSDGNVCGIIPQNETLTLNIHIFDDCGFTGGSIYTSTIGPFDSDDAIVITLDDVVSPGGMLLTETVTGNFTDCDDNPVTDGYVELGNDYYNYLDLVTDGAFEFTFVRCSTTSNTFDITGYDYSSIQQTDDITFTFNTPSTNVGTIVACNSVDEFITYQIDNDTIYSYYFDIETTFTANSPNFEGPTIIIYSNGGTNDCFYLQGVLNEPTYLGTYDMLDWDTAGDTGFFIGECQDISNNNNNIIFNLNALGNVGEYIDINFSGDYEDYQGNPHTIVGTIHVLRDQ